MTEIKLTDYAMILNRSDEFIMYLEDGTEHYIAKSIVESLLYDYCKGRGDDMSE